MYYGLNIRKCNKNAHGHRMGAELIKFRIVNYRKEKEAMRLIVF